MLATLQMPDPLSTPCTLPDYTPELLRWRATLRPWLTGGTTPARSRPLESLSGCTLVQSAVSLVPEGKARKVAFCKKYFTDYFFGKHEASPPVFLTLDEQRYYTDDNNKTIAALRSESRELLEVLGDVSPESGQFYRAMLQAARKHKDFVECVRKVRSAVTKLSSPHVLSSNKPE